MGCVKEKPSIAVHFPYIFERASNICGQMAYLPDRLLLHSGFSGRILLSDNKKRTRELVVQAERKV